MLVAPRRPVPGGRCMGSVAGLSGNEHLPEGQLPPFTRWVHATPAIEQPSSPQVAAASSAVLTEQQVLSWREAGFVCVDGLFAPEVVSAAVKESEETFPQPSPHESAVDLRERYSGRSASIGIGRPDIVFPYASPALNAMTLEPRLITAAAQLLGETSSSNLRLTQSLLWAKYGADNPLGKRWVVDGERFDHGGDQPLHCDFGDNNLVHPPEDQYDTVSCIVFLDDSSVTGGATGVVPRDNEFVSSIWPLPSPSHQTPTSMPQLYEREHGVSATRGTAFLYRHDTWHRGTAVNLGQLRRTLGVVYRRQEAEWVQFSTWTHDYQGKLKAAMPGFTPLQRQMLGFPAVGSSYWTPRTVEAVLGRYPGMDMTPYMTTSKVAARM